MSIVKPKKLVLNNLRKIENFNESNDIENEFENVSIDCYKDSNLDLIEMCVEKAIFNNIDITNSNLEKNSFIDVTFNNCNFSNTSFENSSFIRCEFNNCKLTGCNFVESRIYNVSFFDSNISYANFSLASMENMLFENSILRNSSFQENRLKNIIFKKADLTQAQFFKTSLKEIDFSDSIIEGIAVSIEDIRGAIIDQYQALDLLYLLGVKIKDSFRKMNNLN